jgi:hypothetical protein
VATFNQTWIASEYDVIPPQATATQQFQAVMLRVKNFLTGSIPAVASGAWIVRGSSDSVTANSSDNWAAEADIVNDVPGSPHSWIVLESPAGMLPGGNFIQFTIDNDKDTVGGNPGTEESRIYSTTNVNAFDVSTGTTTARPARFTGVGTEYEVTSGAATDPQWLENDPVLNPHRLHMVRNHRGEFVIIVSDDVVTGLANWYWMCLIADRPTSSTHNYPVGTIAKRSTFGISQSSSTVAGAWSLQGWTDSGVTMNSGFLMHGIHGLASMVDARNDDYNGGLIDQYVLDASSNSTSPSQIGQIGRVADSDIRGAGNQTGAGPDSELDLNPGADPQRYVKINGIYLPIDNGLPAPTI